MDCVGCDKCRLWGKIQTTGLGTAMKVLFELDERNLEYGFPGRTWAHMYSFFFPSPRLNANLLQRSEVVALINTLHRFSESLHAVDVFRGLWRETSAEESAKLIQEAEKAVRIPVGYSGQHCSSYSNIFLATPVIPIFRYKRDASCQLGRSDSATRGTLGTRLQGELD